MVKEVCLYLGKKHQNRLSLAIYIAANINTVIDRTNFTINLRGNARNSTSRAAHGGTIGIKWAQNK